MAKTTKEDLDAKKAQASKDNTADSKNIFIIGKRAKVTIIVTTDATGYDQAAHQASVSKKGKGMISSVYTSQLTKPKKHKTLEDMKTPKTNKPSKP